MNKTPIDLDIYEIKDDFCPKGLRDM